MQKNNLLKKTLIIIFGVLGITLLAFYAKELIKNDDKSDTELIEFSISDTLNINKIIITDVNANKITLNRKGNTWKDGSNGCINQQSVKFILETIKNIEFKGYLPDASLKKFNDVMVAQHIKVDIYSKNKWDKTWYIGPAWQDHYGQVMLLHSKKDGKSTNPVIMKIKGEQGFIDPRFFADKRKWMCTQIFALNLNQIESVKLKFPNESNRDFEVFNEKKQPYVKYKGKKLKAQQSKIYKYLQEFRKVHFNGPNYELSKQQVDSVKSTTPFSILTLKEKSGKSNQLKMYKITSKNIPINESMEVRDMNMDKFWCELQNGNLVKCQFYVFNKIIQGHVYFPEMDVEDVIENNY